jgi:hypothetical protein
VIDYRATVTRVNKEFDSVNNYVEKYEIRYPVEITSVNVAKSITIKEEAPVVVGIFNRSNRAIGISSEYSRLLRVRLDH